MGRHDLYEARCPTPFCLSLVWKCRKCDGFWPWLTEMAELDKDTCPGITQADIVDHTTGEHNLDKSHPGWDEE